MNHQSVNPFEGKLSKTFDAMTDAQLEAALQLAESCFEAWTETGDAQPSSRSTRQPEPLAGNRSP